MIFKLISLVATLLKIKCKSPCFLCHTCKFTGYWTVKKLCSCVNVQTFRLMHALRKKLELFWPPKGGQTLVHNLAYSKSHFWPPWWLFTWPLWGSYMNYIENYYSGNNTSSPLWGSNLEITPLPPYITPVLLSVCHIGKSQGGLIVNVKLHFCDFSLSLQCHHLRTPSPLYLYTVKIAVFRQILMSSLSAFENG